MEEPTSRPRVTIADVARLAGVSKGAVSLALNGKRGVSEETRARIREAAERLQWRPSIHARAMLRSRAYAVGLLLARSPRELATDPFFAAFLGGVETALSGTGWVLLLQVLDPADPAAEEESYRRLAAEGRLDGFFVLDIRIEDPRFAWLGEIGLPAVAVGPAGVDYHGLGHVDVRDGDGIAAAVERLVALGHERIGFVGGAPGYQHSLSRYRAWQEVMRRHGLTTDLRADGHYTADGGAEATRLLLGDRAEQDPGPERPTAIVYASDLMAIAGMSAARELGLEIPRDLSMIGFDDIPAAAHLSPALTTVHQDPVAVGRIAAELLLATIDDRTVPVEVAPPRLIERGSTAPPLSGPTRKS